MPESGGGGGQGTPPTITVTEPSEAQELAVSGYTIRWTDDDPDNDATISLFYDNNNSGHNGTLISGAGSLSESSSLDQFSWNTTGITPGTYYIYARIDDGVNAPFYSYSPGTVKIETGTPSSPPDPLNWRLVDYEPGAIHYGIGYGNNTYLAVGRDTLINRSHDTGLVWSQYSSSSLPDDFDIYDAHYANGRWILVGKQGSRGWLIYSDNVTEGTLPDFTTSISWYGDVLNDIHYADGKWVAVGEPNLVIYSTNNGSSWQVGTINGSSYNFDFQAVDYDNSTDTWIAVSDSSNSRSQVATSHDGINWQQQDLSLGSQKRLRGISVEGGVAVAVGAKTISGDHALLLTSHNGGVTWTDRTVGTDALNDVVYYPEGWVAVGNGSVALSQDGLTWESHPSNLGKDMAAVVYSPDENRLMTALRTQVHRSQRVGGLQHYLIEINVGGSGSVNGFRSSPCRDYCVDSYHDGASFSLVAEPDEGWLLKRWIGGECTNSTSSLCEVDLTESVDIWALFEVDDPPTLTITEPNGVLDKTSDSYTIRWTDSDPDTNATIQLFWDQDADGIGGTLINPSPILEDDESDRYFWDTSGLPEGTYYVYGVIDDGVSPAQTAVSSGPITVIHNTPPSLALLEPDGAGDTADLVFDLVWTDEDPDNDASISFFYDSDNTGADGTPIPEAQNLSENDSANTVQWDISALPEQNFYVYGIIDDGVMDPVTVYSSGPMTVLHVSTNTPPTLSFVQPDGVDDVADLDFQILWTDEDPDNNAQIHLYYDIDGSGADGQWIYGPINEDDESDQWVWDTSTLENGDYFIYAVIDDQVRPPVVAYSSGPVTVVHGNAVPTLTLHEPRAGAHPSDQEFTITWSDRDPDNDASIALYYDWDSTGADGVLIVEGLSEDDEADSYLWNTAGLSAGDYYIYAVVDDGEHTPTTVYSEGTVSIDHQSYGLSWVTQGFGTRRDRVGDVAVDSNGNGYVTGYFEEDFQIGDLTLLHNDDADTFLVKVDPNGTPVWARTFGGERDDYGMGLALDGSDNVYITGYFEDQMQFEATTLTAVGRDDIYVAKLNSSGALQWVEQFGVSGYSKSLDIDVTTAGYVYFTGTFTEQIDIGSALTAVGSSDVFVGKLSTHGSVQWGRQGGGPSTSYKDEGHGIAVDSNGNAYITGQFNQTADFEGHSITATTTYNPDIFVVRYNSNGSVQWARAAGSDGFNRGIAVASTAGYIYVTGWFEGDATFGDITLNADHRPDVFLAKYSASSGNVAWVAHAQGPEDDRGHEVAVTPSNDVVITGQFVRSLQFEDTRLDGRGGFAAMYSSSGSLKWARPVGPVIEFNNYSASHAIAADTSGGVWVAGDLTSTVLMDRDTLTSAGDSDVYLTKIASDGSSNAPPTFTFVEPDGVGDVVADEFAVEWIDGDPDNDALILLFVDDDTQGFDGNLLTPSAISENDEADQFLWDVSALPAGDYYLHAQIADGVNPALRVYAPGPISVDPAAGDDPPTLTIHEPNGINDIVRDGFTITWTAEDTESDASIDLFYDLDAAPGGGTPIVAGLSEDSSTSFFWEGVGLVDGPYYVYGVIDDGVHAPVTAYSSGPVTFDRTPPTVPTLSSISHTVGTPSDEVVIRVSWSGATDAFAGVAGYSFEYSSAVNWTCDQAQDAPAGLNATASDALADGEWYFHLCVVDAVGNWSDSVTAGPYVIETVSTTTSHRDDFNTVGNYNGDDGDRPWPGSWRETPNDGGSPSWGHVRVFTDGDVDYGVSQLRIRRDGMWVERPVDLSGAGEVTLSFDYRREALLDGHYVAAEVSADGSSWTEVVRLAGPADDVGYRQMSVAIPVDTTKIRFANPAGIGMGNGNMVFFDNVEVTLDLGPSMRATVSGLPNTVVTPGGPVTFVITVENTSPFGTLELTTLEGSLNGEAASTVDGSGTCNLSQSLAVGETYTCQLEREVTGSAGSSVEYQLTATGTVGGELLTAHASTTVGVLEDVEANAKDSFASVSYAGDDGTVPWTSNWIEAPIDGSQASWGDVRILEDGIVSHAEGPYQAFIRDDQLWLRRKVDLTGFSAAELDFDYRRSNLLTGQRLDIEVSTDGVTFERLASIEGSEQGTDLNYSRWSPPLDLSPYISSSTWIQFSNLEELGMGNSNAVYLDNVEIRLQSGSSIALGLTVDPDTVVEPSGPVTFEVTVTNHSPSGSVELTELADDQVGDLQGVGSCSTPRTVLAGDSYVCSYGHTVSGAAGSTIIHVVSAVASAGGEMLNADSSVEVTVEAPGLETLRDELKSVSFHGNDGTVPWSSPWIESISDGGAPYHGHVRVEEDAVGSGPYALRIRRDDLWVQREADLSGFAQASLTFDYRRNNLLAGHRVDVEVSLDGSSWTTLDQLEGPALDQVYQRAVYDLSPWISAATWIRFHVPGGQGMGNANLIYFDNIEIQLTEPVDSGLDDQDPERLGGNLLSNPSFEQGLGYWELISPEPLGILPSELEDSAFLSRGRAAAIQSATGEGRYALAQCVRIEPGRLYHFGGEARAQAPSFTDPVVSMGAELFGEDDCGGEVLSATGEVLWIGDSEGLWQSTYGGRAEASEKAVSARVWVVVQGEGAEGFRVWLDRLSFRMARQAP